MGLSHSPRIVTDGLVFCVDAGDKMSYPGAGTTWTDLSHNSTNFTLLNGASYDSDKSISFDGTNDYASGVNDLSNVSLSNGFTVSFWFKPTTEGRGRYILSIENAASESVLRVYERPESAGYISCNVYGTGSYFALSEGGPGSSWPVGEWYHCTAIHRGTTSSADFDWYFNAVESIARGWTYRFRYTAGSPSDTKTPDGRITIGWGAFSPGGSDSRYYNGLLSNLQIYNRALTDEEITQNYNATRGRFQ